MRHKFSDGPNTPVRSALVNEQLYLVHPNDSEEPFAIGISIPINAKLSEQANIFVYYDKQSIDL
jgi:hypothetical protein